MKRLTKRNQEKAKSSRRRLRLEPMLKQLSPLGVEVPKPKQVLGYLERFRKLGAHLPEICQQLRAGFGPETELSLEVYEDPEIDDRYLCIYVRQTSYDTQTLTRLDAVCAGIDDRLEKLPGYLLITTDFRYPRGRHAV